MSHRKPLILSTLCVSLCRWPYHLVKKYRRFFSKSDPYYELQKSREDGSWVTCYRSLFLRNTLNPAWPVAKRIPLQTLCNGDLDRPIRIQLYDWDMDGTFDDMGHCEVTVRRLLGPAAQKDGFPVIETLKSGKTKQSGTVYVKPDTPKQPGASVHRYDTFLDYIQGGWELNMVVAVDWTGSNGNPAQPSSLHYRWEGKDNMYQQAIRSLGGVIDQYDTDKRYPAYGFGGRKDGKVSHCFPLNGDAAHPEVDGVDGILAAYGAALGQWGLSGPTVFAEVIGAAAAMAADTAGQHSSENCGTYTILLILTDGAITDLEATKDAIVAASGLPLSIIIVGVGDADFTSMVSAVHVRSSALARVSLAIPRRRLQSLADE